MKLRDQIAIAAMAAIIRKTPFGVVEEYGSVDVFSPTACGAYSYADEMLKRRLRKPARKSAKPARRRKS